MKTDSKLFTYSLIGLSVLAVGGIAAFFIFRKKGGDNSSNGNNSVSSEIPSAAEYKSFGTEPIQVAKSFEPLAFGKYRWAGGSGMPIDIKFRSSSPLFTKMADGSTYCTGFTFAVCFTVCLNRGLLEDFSDSDIKEMHTIWNQGNPTTKPKLCVDAISKPIASNLKALGKEVSLENCEANDFCQIWRTTGTGHSVIVVEKVVQNGKITGIKYVSSNYAVNPNTGRSGYGEKTEYFSDSGGTLIRANTYFARLNQ